MTSVHGGSGPVSATTPSYTSSKVATARSPAACVPTRHPRRAASVHTWVSTAGSQFRWPEFVGSSA